MPFARGTGPALPKKKNKNKRIDYNFKPKKVTEAKITEIALHEDQVREMAMQRKVTDLVLKGYSYDDISQKFGISTVDAFNLSKRAIAEWSGPLAHGANELKEIELRRYDAYTALLTETAFPHPILDPNTGEPQRDPNGKIIMTPPDLEAMKLLLMVSDKRCKITGIEAADKLRERVAEVMTRRYIGVDPDVL